MKRILLIGTGGTIASELGENGLKPELNSEELLKYLPDISKTCQVDCIQLCSLDSTNITPEHWLMVANAIHDNYEKYDGFVIAHGTDTMAYTAAGLSYLIQGSPKPIVFTGAQKPIGYETTDSKQNLRDAFTVASSDMAGVMIVFSGKIIVGTRARKTHSKRFSAFSSINYPSLGHVSDGQLIAYIHPECDKEPVFYSKIDSKVALLKLVPGMKSDVAEYLLNTNDALIIESFGVGGLPSYNDDGFFDVIKRGIEAGKLVVMTTQVENEGSDLDVYSVGSTIKKSLPIFEAYDMTTEAVVAKVMWILGETKNLEMAEKLFYSPIANDIIRGRRE